MLGFMAELENYRDTVDIKILRDKARIKDQINFGEFEPKSCDTALLYYDDEILYVRCLKSDCLSKFTYFYRKI